MLWSQFSAIFDNFRQKNGVFLKNQCYDQNFAKFSFILSQKRQFFSLGSKIKNFLDKNGPDLSYVLKKIKTRDRCYDF
jgi:hypothetical protein